MYIDTYTKEGKQLYLEESNIIEKINWCKCKENGILDEKFSKN